MFSEYIKTVIGGLKTWVLSRIHGVEENTDRMMINVQKAEEMANTAKTTANSAKTTAAEAKLMVDNLSSQVSDDHINSLIDTKLGVIEDGSY